MGMTSCSWCHELNDTYRTHCRCCGHQVGVPRMDCDCDQCCGQINVELNFYDQGENYYGQD